MRCKDCYHYKICENNLIQQGMNTTSVVLASTVDNSADDCPYFQDKSMLVELQCNVGDKVYVCYASPYGVQKTTIDKIIIHKEFTQVVFTNHSEFTVLDNDWSTYKKAVFFTRDEAEKALEEHKNETD